MVSPVMFNQSHYKSSKLSSRALLRSSTVNLQKCRADYFFFISLCKRKSFALLLACFCCCWKISLLLYIICITRLWYQLYRCTSWTKKIEEKPTKKKTEKVIYSRQKILLFFYNHMMASDITQVRRQIVLYFLQ